MTKHKKPVSEVCSLLDKKCSGTVSFYLTESKKLGALLLEQGEEGEPDIDDVNLQTSTKYKEFLKKLQTGSDIGTLKTSITFITPSNVDVNISELQVKDKILTVAKKTMYGSKPEDRNAKIIYTITGPNNEDLTPYFTVIKKAFALEAFLQSELSGVVKHNESEGEEGGNGEESFGPSGMGGFEPPNLF